MAAVPTDPWAAAFSAMGPSVAQALAPTPNTAVQTGSATTVTMDGSAWTVATGGSNAEATNSRNADVPAVAGAVGKVLGSSSTVLIACAALAAVVLVKLLKKS